jgi:Ca2+-binding EF-hand superfamily protein
LPYFKDIYCDLVTRSDDKHKGINKVTFVEYTQLPGLLAERLFSVWDVDKDDYLSQKEMLAGLLRLFCSTFNQKIGLVYQCYDFDGDGMISKKDILTLLTSMPTVHVG